MNIFIMAKTASLPNELYFVTLTIVDWIDLFTRRTHFDFIIDNLEYCRQNKNLEIFDYVIMTNHIHMICRGKDKPLSDILRDFKSFTSKKIVKQIIDNPKESRRKWIVNLFRESGRKNVLNKHFQVWKNFNYPTLLSSQFLINQKRNYIYKNPVKAGFVAFPENYLYCSACPDSPLKVSAYQ